MSAQVFFSPCRTATLTRRPLASSPSTAHDVLTRGGLTLLGESARGVHPCGHGRSRENAPLHPTPLRCSRSLHPLPSPSHIKLVFTQSPQIPTRAALHGRHIAAADWSSRRRTRGTDCSAGNISSRGESEGVDSSGRRGSHRWRVRVAAGSAGGSRGSDGASRPLSAPVPPPVVPSPAAAAAAGRGQHAAGADRDDGSATPGRGAAAALNQAETASEPPPHGGSTTGAGREGAGANARAESRDCIADEAAEAGPEMRAEAEGGSSARFRETLQMVETAMLAATSGLAFFLANSLRVEGYLGFFFPLPAVVASMRWGATAGLRTAISAAFLLLVLAGPIKAITFLVSPTLLSCSSGISSASHLYPSPLSPRSANLRLHNMLSSKALPNNNSPFKEWTGKHPDTRMLRVFGCMVQYRPHTAQTGKFEDRARWGIHLGIESEYHAWTILDFATHQLTRSRDCIFYERLTLPLYRQHRTAQNAPDNIFQGQHSFTNDEDDVDVAGEQPTEPAADMADEATFIPVTEQFGTPAYFPTNIDPHEAVQA
ncbi:unnamed protein product [Closterium sp. NIES-53]